MFQKFERKTPEKGTTPTRGEEVGVIAFQPRGVGLKGPGEDRVGPTIHTVRE